MWLSANESVLNLIIVTRYKNLTNDKWKLDQKSDILIDIVKHFDREPLNLFLEELISAL